MKIIKINLGQDQTQFVKFFSQFLIKIHKMKGFLIQITTSFLYIIKLNFLNLLWKIIRQNKLLRLFHFLILMKI